MVSSGWTVAREAVTGGVSNRGASSAASVPAIRIGSRQRTNIRKRRPRLPHSKSLLVRFVVLGQIRFVLEVEDPAVFLRGDDGGGLVDLLPGHRVHGHALLGV